MEVPPGSLRRSRVEKWLHGRENQLHVAARRKKYLPKGDVTLVNLQRQLATPIRNACFSHELADMLHCLLNRFQKLPTRCSTANIAKKKSSATGCYASRTIFRATSYHCKLALQVDQCNITFSNEAAAENWVHHLFDRLHNRALWTDNKITPANVSLNDRLFTLNPITVGMWARLLSMDYLKGTSKLIVIPYKHSRFPAVTNKIADVSSVSRWRSYNTFFFHPQVRKYSSREMYKCG